MDVRYLRPGVPNVGRVPAAPLPGRGVRVMAERQGRTGFALNDKHIPCSQCGEVHEYLTGHIDTPDGPLCNVPILWTPMMPGPSSYHQYADPPHGAQALMATPGGDFRLAFVWRADREG